MWFIKLRAWVGMCGVCMGVCECAQVCMGGPGCVWKCTHVCGYTWVCIGKGDCVWDEFSEYLLETRVLTSADFNTYPIQIFLIEWTNKKCNKLFLHGTISQNKKKIEIVLELHSRTNFSKKLQLLLQTFDFLKKPVSK